jgi:hypothetical protein
MAKTYEFDVSGQGRFPIDMLRYDRCSPASEADSSIVERTFDLRAARVAGQAQGNQMVRLVGPHPPTEGRWQSFGWRVMGQRVLTR